MNIENSSSVGLFKKPRKLNDGTLVWDSVIKLRKKNAGECSKSPKMHLGIRNGWIKQFSNLLSDKASTYVVETLCSDRTNRQEEIAKTLLNRFNTFLEQEATMKDPKTKTHKVMVMMADKLSLWLDRNVKVSKNVGVRLQQFKEEEEKKRLIDQRKRREQERREKEEEKKRKDAEDLAKKLGESKSAHEVLNAPPDTQADLGGRGSGEEQAAREDETSEGQGQKDGSASTQEQSRKPDDADKPPPDPATESPPTTAESPEDLKTTGVSEAEKDIGGSQEVVEGPESTIDEELAPISETPAESKDDRDQDVNDVDNSEAFDGGTNIEVDRVKSSGSIEPDVPEDSPLRRVLSEGGAKSAEEKGERASTAEGQAVPSADDKEYTTEMNESQPTPEYEYTPTVDATKSEDSSLLSAGYDSEDTGVNIESSKDSATLVQELLGYSEEQEDESDANLTDNDGEGVNEKTDRVLKELAEMIASTRESHSPLQEAIKDVMGKELEDRLGDKDAEVIDKVAGKVGTWIDKMVERVGEEYGDGERSPSRARSKSPHAVSFPGTSSQTAKVPVGESRHLPLGPHAAPPLPAAAPPEGHLSRTAYDAISPLHAPVSQKPKGPIFKLRKVDTKNIFNVVGISHTKAKRKIREARGQSPHRVSQDSLDFSEWAEWAGLVSDVSQNWAKWIEGVTRGALDERQELTEETLSSDAKEWKSINKELQREADAWLAKVKRRKSKSKKNPASKAVSV